MQAWNNKIGHTRGYCKEMSQCYAFSYEKCAGSCKDKSEQNKLRLTMAICIEFWGKLKAKIYRRIQQISLNRRTAHFLQQNRRIKFKIYFESEWGLHNMPLHLYTWCANNASCSLWYQIFWCSHVLDDFKICIYIMSICNFAV